MNRTRIGKKNLGCVAVVATAAAFASAFFGATAATADPAPPAPAHVTYYTGFGSDPGTVNVGDGPRDVAFDPSGHKAYVTNNIDDTISVIDTASGALVDTIRGLPADPIAVAVNPKRDVAYVSTVVGLSVVDVTSDRVTGTITGYTGAGSTSVVFTSDGAEAFVTNPGNNSISVIDTATDAQVGVVAGYTGDEPHELALSPDGRTAYVADAGSNSISIIDVASTTQTGRISGFTGVQPEGVAISPDGAIAYVTNQGSASISVLDLAAGSQSGTVAGFSSAHPYRAAFSHDGKNALVTTGAYGPVLQIDVATNTEIGTVGSLVAGARPYNGSSPTNVAFQPGADTAYIANYDSNTVSLVTQSAAPAFVHDAPSVAAMTGAPFDYTFAAAGAPAEDRVSYGVVGTLPPGLLLNPSTGTLSGTPTAAGTWTFTITAANLTGTTQGATHEVTVSAPTAPVITSPDHVIGKAGDTITPFTVTATGAPAPRLSTPALTHAAAPSADSTSQLLPDGVDFDATTGKVTGTIAGSVAPGDYSFDITADNGTLPSATQRFTVRVVPAALGSTSGPAPAVSSPAPVAGSPAGPGSQREQIASLAHTGSDIVDAGAAAIAILLAGTVLLIWGRLRRRAPHRVRRTM